MARPPRIWELRSAVLIAATAVLAVLSMLYLATDLTLIAYIRTGGTSGVSSLADWIVEHAPQLDILSLLLLIGLLVGFVRWRRGTHRMLTGFGITDSRVTRHWTVTAWNITFLPVVVIQFVNASQPDTPAEWSAMLTWDAVQLGLRLLAFTFLLLGVWHIRDVARTRVMAEGVVARFQERPLTPVEVPAGELPSADDAFWARVGELAVTAGADLALLESREWPGPRWLLVPASGDLTAVRAEITPGSTVLVFAEPPTAGGTEGFEPPAADAYYGLLDLDELRFEKVMPFRLAAFLSRARSARRWALYPVSGPAPLSAVVPGARARA